MKIRDTVFERSEDTTTQIELLRKNKIIVETLQSGEVIEHFMRRHGNLKKHCAVDFYLKLFLAFHSFAF